MKATKRRRGVNSWKWEASRNPLPGGVAAEVAKNPEENGIVPCTLLHAEAVQLHCCSLIMPVNFTNHRLNIEEGEGIKTGITNNCFGDAKWKKKEKLRRQRKLPLAKKKKNYVGSENTPCITSQVMKRRHIGSKEP
eukprot:1138197-Pelagomonas_calceolata.AAC.4